MERQIENRVKKQGANVQSPSPKDAFEQHSPLKNSKHSADARESRDGPKSVLDAAASKAKDIVASERRGSFVWLELKTPDVDAASAFYNDVVGWKRGEIPMGDFVYALAMAGDAPVGGFLSTDASRASFLGYLSVDDVDQCLARIESHGGRVLEKALDVPDVGRMATVTTPDGATFSVMRSAHGDEAHHPRPGALGWMELWTTREAETLTFIDEALGQSHQDMPMGESTYRLIQPPGATAATPGVWGVTLSPTTSPVFVPYLIVDDVDDAVHRAVQRSASVSISAMDVPDTGRIAVLEDPQGALFGLLAPVAR